MAYKALPIYHIVGENIPLRKFQSYFDLVKLVKSGCLTKDTYVWCKKRKGFNTWIKAKRVSELEPLFANMPELPKEFIYDDDLDDLSEKLHNQQKLEKTLKNKKCKFFKFLRNNNGK